MHHSQSPGGRIRRRPAPGRQARAARPAADLAQPPAAGRGRPRPGPRSPRTCWPRRAYAARPPWRRTSRSAPSPAPACCSTSWSPRASGCCCPWCCPTSTSTGRSTTGGLPGARAEGAARAGRAPARRRRGRDRRRRARAGTGRLARRRPAGPRRRVLRPGPGAGAGRHVHVRAALRRRGGGRRCRWSPTTGPCSPPPARPGSLLWVRARRVRVSSAASSTASRENGQGRVSPSAQRSVWSV